MKLCLAAIAIAVVVTSLGGCLQAPVVPPQGAIFTAWRAPLDTDMDPTQLPQKSGEASTHSVLGLVAWGDAGVSAAARNGRLTKIHHADYEFLSILFGIYTQFTLVVYGE
jgi:hypothetical protein